MAVSSSDVLSAFATSIATAVITAAVTVRLSVRQFQSQKWWERKVDAYTRIIEALQAMYRFSSEAFEAGIEGRELSAEYAAALSAGWRSGRDELKRAIGYGSLVISSEAYRALEELEDALGAARRELTWTEHLDSEAAALGTCLGDIRTLAAKDLGIARHPKPALLPVKGRPGTRAVVPPID